MSKGKQFVVILLGLCMVLGASVVVFADSMKIKEIANDNKKIRNQELIVEGEIASIAYRGTTTSTIISMDSSKEDKKKNLETNIYLVSDETDDVYILSTKHYDEKQKITFKTFVLMNSKDKVGNEQVMLYDKYISAKIGMTSPGMSKFMLERLLNEAEIKKSWVLLIDIE
ncbi:MAG: hypothetical protein ACM3YE_14775 [Bacteroidota bacterium]